MCEIQASLIFSFLIFFAVPLNFHFFTLNKK